MQKLAIIFSLIVVAGMNTALFAQDQGSEKKTDQSMDKKLPNMETAEEMTKMIMLKMFEKAGLDAEQTKKVTSIIDEYVRPLVTGRQEFQSILTSDQQRKLNNAKKQARKAKYSDDDAEKYGLKKLKLDEATQKKYLATKAKVLELNDKMNSAIGAVLTDEQKEKLPIFKDQIKKEDAAKKGGSGTKAADAKGSETKAPVTKGSGNK